MLSKWVYRVGGSIEPGDKDMEYYVTHTCKNPDCGRGFIDFDRHKAETNPPKWRYCPKCEGMGFSNKRTRGMGVVGTGVLKKWERGGSQNIKSYANRRGKNETFAPCLYNISSSKLNTS